MDVPQMKGLLALVVVFCIGRVTTTIASTVKLQLRGVDCADTCFYNKDEEECYSSIKVNGEEKSLREEGLNIVVIDTKTGQIQQKHFGLLFQVVSKRRKREFLNYFKNINEGSVVIIVSDDMCSLYFSGWYNYLTLNTNIFKANAWKPGAQVSIAVGCQGDCPVVANETLPYSYFGYQSCHEKSLTFKIKELPPYITLSPQPSSSKPTTPSTVVTSSTSRDNTPLIIGVVAAVIILILLLILVIFMLKMKGKKEISKNLFVCLKCETSSTSENITDENQDATSTEVMFHNGSYAVQPNVLCIAPVPVTEEIRYSDLATKTYQNTQNEYQCLKKESVHYEKIDNPLVNEYTYVEPALHKDRIAENMYYTPGLIADIRDRSDTEMTSLSVSPGTSHQIFKHSMENISEVKIPLKNFASYVTISHGPLYKCPSNVPKFDAPSAKPQSIERMSYIDMEVPGLYDNTTSDYQPLTKKEGEEETYETLR